GAALPRRDHETSISRYSRLMLIFFKPWTDSKQLRLPGQTWPEAFEDFLVVCPDKYKKIMDNMQVFHECRDSRNN
ncbi:hypothetical protein BJ138DRAFT_990295, partial [Hygrophoropsis aurantiaca]